MSNDTADNIIWMLIIFSVFVVPAITIAIGHLIRVWRDR